MRYEVPEFDFDTPEGAVAALRNPNYAVRYLAWSSLNEFQESGYPLYSSGEPSYPWTRAVGGEDRGN